MSPTREHTLPTLPENSDVKQSADEDEEDREEQIQYEKDNAEAAYALRNDGEDNDKTTDDTADPGPFYVQSSQGDNWELTWPIWHLLPRGERQAIAIQHGMKTIGEFEEYMSLTRAVDESEGGRVAVQAPSNSINDSSMDNIASSGSRDDGGVEESNDTTISNSLNTSTTSDWQPPFITKIEEEVEDDDDSSVSSSDENDTTTTDGEETDSSNDMNEMDVEELIKLGGYPCALPLEILHRAFSYLSIDDHASLALVSPYWARFTRCEALYKTLCERIYLNQSKRKMLHVSRFGNSYRRMLEVRPRVRAGGGLYVLKYEKVQKIERDMWTEIPVGAVLVNVYYRYLYFFEDGRVMYALTHISPMEMIPRFSKMLLHGYGSKDKWGVWGRYQIKKDIVRVWASQKWTDVCFQLKVITSNRVLHYDSGDKGVCTTMKLEDHMTSISSNFDDDSNDLVRYDLPSGEQSYFRFLRDRRL